MITEDYIITNALLRLGEIGSYSDTRSSIYKRSEFLLKNLIEVVGKDAAFSFNAITIVLTRTKNLSVLGEYQFNRPLNMINFIHTIPKANSRLEGEHFYSDQEELKLRYLKKMNLSEYPDYLKEYLVFALAKNIAEVHNSYAVKLEYVTKMLREEEAKIMVNEGFEFRDDIDLVGVIF